MNTQLKLRKIFKRIKSAGRGFCFGIKPKQKIRVGIIFAVIAILALGLIGYITGNKYLADYWGEPPALYQPIPDQTVEEGMPLTVDVLTTDPDSHPMYCCGPKMVPLPVNQAYYATPVPNLDNVYKFQLKFHPSYGQAGQYLFKFNLSDGPHDVEIAFNLTVTPGTNQAPVFDTVVPPQKSFNENKITFPLPAYHDPNLDNIVLTTENLPEGAVIDTVKNTFTWTPTSGQMGHFNTTFRISDGNLEASQTVSFDITQLVRGPGGPENVLVIVNDNSTASIDVGNHYQKMRNIPSSNIVHINTTTEWVIDGPEYYSQIEAPIKSYLETNNLKYKILYIVPTYGVPIRVNDQVHLDQCNLYEGNTCTRAAAAGGKAFSVDSYLSTMFITKDQTNAAYIVNPYSKISWGSYDYFKGPFAPGTRFDNTNGIYLVSRLDGPSFEIAKGLTDKALYAEKYINSSVGNAYEYGSLNGGLLPSPESTGFCAAVERAGYNCTYDRQAEGGPTPLWRSLWGFSDSVWHTWDVDWDRCHPGEGHLANSLIRTDGCDKELGYRNWDNFLPGGIGIHIRSYTGYRNIRNSNDTIIPAYLLANDVTGTTGTIDEPYLNGLTDPVSFFDFFLNGNSNLGIKHFNFAESMYMSMDYLYWRLYIVGDPLYRLSDNNNNDNEKPKLENLNYSYSGNTATIEWDNAKSINNSPEVTYGGADLSDADGNHLETEWNGTHISYFDEFKKNAYTHHKITFTGLDQSEKYQVNVNAIDPNNNTTTKHFEMIYSNTPVNINTDLPVIPPSDDPINSNSNLSSEDDSNENDDDSTMSQTNTNSSIAPTSSTTPEVSVRYKPKITRVSPSPTAVYNTEAKRITGTRFSGVADPNSLVNITIQSDPIHAQTIADTKGYWTYTLNKELLDGVHSITIWIDVNGEKVTASNSFVVDSAKKTAYLGNQINGSAPVAAAGSENNNLNTNINTITQEQSDNLAEDITKQDPKIENNVKTINQRHSNYIILVAEFIVLVILTIIMIKRQRKSSSF